MGADTCRCRLTRKVETSRLNGSSNWKVVGWSVESPEDSSGFTHGPVLPFGGRGSIRITSRTITMTSKATPTLTNSMLSCEERNPSFGSPHPLGTPHWYRRILAASWSPAAVFEAVYHACRSAEELIRSANLPIGQDVKSAVTTRS